MTKNLAKDVEIEIFQSFIKSLPSCSYLRPALADLLPDIERDIKSDIIPNPRQARAELYHELLQAEHDLKRAQNEQREQIRDIKNGAEYIANLRQQLESIKKIAANIAELAQDKLDTMPGGKNANVI